MKETTNLKTRRESAFQVLFTLILIIYPLRHITWGLDLWDTGYNYANFQYMGLEHMDPMWLFSTYLANAAGHFFTKLPFADGLVGMNFYTGLFVSLLAVAGYFFCTRKLGIKPWVAFLGELTAISLCWCPTALLYNYLTYVLFLGCVILLYTGLSGHKMQHLFLAGICLGMNVFVRFSNLPQAAMIAAVWAYALIEWLEERKEARTKKGRFPRAIRYTLWCLGGYLAALFVFGLYVHLRYGLDAYFAGIARLFAMTENATDYKASSMLMGLIGTYVENLYWVLRIGVIAAGGLGLFAAAHLLREYFYPVRKNSRILWCMVSAAMLGWLYYRGFCTMEFYSYASVLRPGILFLMLTMLIAVVRIFHKNSPKEEKLISGLVLLVVLLTSIGSNNGVYPSMNNLFIAGPYTLWESYRFFRYGKECNVTWKPFRWLQLSAFPLKGLLAAFLAMFLFQTAFFGMKFVFAEATGVQDVSARVENNKILRGVGMSPEKARFISEISAYVEEAGLQGREVILYGQIPSLSYYLQMPSAFNPWSDLRSYSPETFAEALSEVEGEAADGAPRPVVILENKYASRLSEGQAGLLEAGAEDLHVGENSADKKWSALAAFLERLAYEQTFSNEKFTILE